MILRTSHRCDLDPGHFLEVFREQRKRFIGVLQGFSSDDWAAPTRCPEWSAHDVIRHMCNVSDAITLCADDRTLDMTAGFDPRTTPQRWLNASADEEPNDTLNRFTAKTEDLFTIARDRLARGSRFDVHLPFGPADWTILTLHIFWDSWIHERDVMLARGAAHPTSDAATRYATAYGLFIAATVAVMFGETPSHTFNFGGIGGGIFDLDSRGGVTLTVTQVTVTGWPATQVADELAGRPQTHPVLSDLPADTRTALTRLADFFNTPV